MAAYHKGYTPKQRKAVDRNRKRKERAEKTEKDVRTKEVIVWDGEGMKLSGNNRPQHYVLFGCSVEPDSPLIINEPTGHLSFEQIADYCLSVVKKHPHAIHLGYFFKYDQNMIIQSLHWIYKRRLYSDDYCRYPSGDSVYYIRITWGKTLAITRVRGDDKVSILIEDFAPFFASSFVKAYQTLFPKPTDPENWAIVEQGKLDRADMLYDDMAKVQRYWRAEIIALQELAFEFRRLMFNGDFMLNRWHGPGALAEYIRRNYDLIKHEYGGKEENLPPEVHTASRGAFFGGRFEQFQVGYIRGPIYSYDVNSAYPHAFCQIPSLSEGGFWQRLGPIDTNTWRHDHRLRTSFSVYHVRWKGEGTPGHILQNRVIQPLPHRGLRDQITYPQFTSGWYWGPEVAMAMKMAQMIPGAECEITDGWTWNPLEETYPWNDVLNTMYQRRRVLKDNNNPTQMAFKLGPNSMYGKMAQRIGGKDKAPSSHTLPIAGYITSRCRAMVMMLMMCCNQDKVISVETDGVFTTTPPDKLRYPEWFPLSKELGEWDLKEYDAMVLLQNGVYLLQKGDEWFIKSRGIPVDNVEPDRIIPFLSECKGDRWPVLTFQSRETFLSLATSIARSTKMYKGKRWLISTRARQLHCTWVSSDRELNIEGHGSKRVHHSRWCRACQQGLSAAETAHDMLIHSEATVDHRLRESNLYQLPWMKEYVEPEWILAKQQEEDEYDD
jgi:hypothetical protein